MKTFEWQGILPVFSRKELSSKSLYILQTDDTAFIAFSRDTASTQPFDLVPETKDAHRFSTFERALSVKVELFKRYREHTEIVVV